MKKTLVTCCVNLDIDGVAGSIAYAEFLDKTSKKVTVGILGEPYDEAKYILDRFNLKYPEVFNNVKDFEEVILVDASDLDGLDGKVPPEKVIEIIDHRKVHEADKFKNAKVQIELVGSVCTLIAEKFIQNNIEISKESATLLCGAIISNTINFKSTVTTERDKKAFEWLNKRALLPNEFSDELFKAKSNLSGEKLKEQIYADFANFYLNSKKVGIAQLEIIGVKELIEQREKEVLDILNLLKQEMNLDFVFLNAIDLKIPNSTLIADDKETQKLLEKIFDIKFDTNYVELKNLIMRKQIVPLLKNELELIK